MLNDFGVIPTLLNSFQNYCLSMSFECFWEILIRLKLRAKTKANFIEKIFFPNFESTINWKYKGTVQSTDLIVVDHVKNKFESCVWMLRGFKCMNGKVSRAGSKIHQMWRHWQRFKHLNELFTQLMSFLTVIPAISSIVHTHSIDSKFNTKKRIFFNATKEEKTANGRCYDLMIKRTYIPNFSIFLN